MDFIYNSWQNLLKIGALGVLLIFMAPFSWADDPAADWQLAKESEGIKVWVKPNPGSDFKMFRGQVLIHAPLSAVTSVLEDVPNFPKWYHKMTEAKVVRRLSDTESLRYSVTDMPWPVTDRDSVVLTRKEALAPNHLRFSFKAAPGAYPLQPDRIRVPKLEGYWDVKAINGGTLVTFEAAAEPGGMIPSWLANQLVVDMPYQTLTKLRRQLGDAPPIEVRSSEVEKSDVLGE
jgi:hypothetical protein